MFDKINQECKLSGNYNIPTNNKSNIKNDITNTTHMLVKVREDKESLNQ